MENPNNSPSTNGNYNSMQMPESQMSIQDYLAILYRSRWWIAAIFLITVAGVSYITFTTPPTYQASTTIILDENQGVGQSLFDVTGYSQQRAHINNHVEILKSIFLPTAAMASTLLSSKTDSLQVEELTEENSSIVKIAFAGDIQPHEFEDPLYSSSIFRLLLERIADEEPNWFVLLGDFMKGGYIDNKVTRKAYDNLLELADREKFPIMFVPGNHDIWDDYSASQFESRLGPRNWTYDIPETNFTMIALESSPFFYTDSSWTSVEEYKHLVSFVTASESSKIIFATHHPLWQDARWKRQLLPLFDGRLEYYFSGHHHGYTWHEEDGVKYIISGGGGASMYHDKRAWNGGFHHYGLLTIKGEETDFEIKPIIHTNPFHSDYSYETALTIGKANELWRRNQKTAHKKELRWDLLFFSVPIIGIYCLSFFPRNWTFWGALGMAVIITIILTQISHYIPYRYLLSSSLGLSGISGLVLTIKSGRVSKMSTMFYTLSVGGLYSLFVLSS